MWKWLEKIVGTYEKPLVLTNEVKPKRARGKKGRYKACLLYTSPSPRDLSTSRMPSSA